MQKIKNCAKVQADGLYHQNRLAVALKWFISYINDVSASIHPITQRISPKNVKKSRKIGKIQYPAAGLSTDTIPLLSHFCLRYGYAEGHWCLRCQLEHVDQGLSLTLYARYSKGLTNGKLKTNKTTRDLSILSHHAFNKGIKLHRITSVPLPMMVGEVGANHVKAVSFKINSDPLLPKKSVRWLLCGILTIVIYRLYDRMN